MRMFTDGTNTYVVDETTKTVTLVTPVEVAALAAPASNGTGRRTSPKLTKDQHKAATARGILKSLGADTSVVDGLAPAPKAAKPVPAFIVEKAQNSAKRKALAAALRAQGLPTNGPAWDEAKKAAGIK